MSDTYTYTPATDLQPEDMVDMDHVFQYLFYLDIEPDHTDWDNARYELWQVADPATEPGRVPDMVIMHFENNHSYAVPADLKVPVLNQPRV